MLGRLQPAERWAIAGMRIGEASEHGLRRRRGDCRRPGGTTAHRPGEVRLHLQRQPEPLPRQLVRGLRDRHPFHRRLGGQRDRRQRLRRKPEPGEVRRHAVPRLVEGRARQLLERQPGLRPRWRWPGRYRLPPERPDRPGVVDGAAGQGADEQPRRAGDPLGAGAVPGPAAGRRRRQPSAHRRRRAQPDTFAERVAGRDAATVEMRANVGTKRFGKVEAVRDVSFELPEARRSRSSATTAPARRR